MMSSLLADGGRRRVQVLGGHLRHRARGQGPGGDRGELDRAQAEQDLREQLGELRLHRHPPGEPAALDRHPAREHRRDLLVGAVLQQPGEQQVPGLQQGQVLLVLDLARWAAGRAAFRSSRVAATSRK